MESSPGCWAVYGKILAREYSNPSYMRSHRQTVDAYAVQHPGRPSPQSVQSVAVHLIALHLALELHKPSAQIVTNIKSAADTGTFSWLDPPMTRGAMTVCDVVRATNAEEHAALVGSWALSVWEAWSSHHAQVRAWANAFSGR